MQVTEFEFLGYTFRREFIKDRLGRLQFNFLPSVSAKSAKAFRDKIKSMRIHSYTGSKIEIIAEMLSSMVRGWLNYFTKFNPSAVKYTIDCLNRRLVKWQCANTSGSGDIAVERKNGLKNLQKENPICSHIGFSE